MQWPILLRAVGAAVTSLFGPTILAYYARRDTSGLVDYTQRAVKLSGLMIALPVGLICGLSAPVLQVWLGPEFVPLAPLLSLVTAHLCINLSVCPLFSQQAATGRVRLPGIVTCVTGLAFLGTSILMTGHLGLGVYGVALAECIILTAKNAFFTPLYGAYILNQPWWTFFRSMLLTAFLTAAIAAGSWTATAWIDLASWPRLITYGLIVALGVSILAWFVVLNAKDRSILVSQFVMSKTRKGPDATRSG
jgi:membrane protein EpsK